MFGSIPNLGLIVENGCRIKEANSSSYTEAAKRATASSWKESVKKILQYYLERMPGAEIEEREYSLLFHHDACQDKLHATRQAVECVSLVNDSCERQRVHAIQRNHCIIVEPLDWTKCTATARVYENLADGTDETSAVDFMMVVGQDAGDEQVFRWANKLEAEGAVEDVFTVSLGSGHTQASTTLMRGANSESPFHFCSRIPETDLFAGVCMTLHRLTSHSMPTQQGA